jgi:hypothetical protein
MDRVTDFLDSLSFPFLAILAVLMAMAPWPAGPEPHLLEKSRMLLAGQLTRPLDIFDLFIHGLPSILLLAKAIYLGSKRE